MSTQTTRGFLIASDAQAKMTLNRMRQKVRQAVLDHDFVWWARKELHKLAPDAFASRNWSQVARAVRQYVGAHIRFTPDPVGDENLTPPLEHMRMFQNGATILLGDCDDAATLSAAMAEAVGIPAEFVLRAFYKPDNPYQHVLTVLHPKGGGAMVSDTTRDAQRLPPVATREFRMRV
ncbi:MAG: transglutaminase domain-containing protein [Chthoniobacterales bacterium]